MDITLAQHYSIKPVQNSSELQILFLLLGGKLLAQRCRTDDLMSSIPFLCLPPSRVDPKVLGPNVFVYHS